MSSALIQDYMNPISAFACYFLNIHFNIIPSTPRSSNQFLSTKIPTRATFPTRLIRLNLTIKITSGKDCKSWRCTYLNFCIILLLP